MVHPTSRHIGAAREGTAFVDLVRRPEGGHYRPRTAPRPAIHQVGAFLLALVLLIGFVPTLGGMADAAAGDPVVTRENGTNGCNGVRPTPGSENTTKRLDPDFPSDLSPGGAVGYIIDFPVDPADVSGRETFVITDCVFVNGTAIAKYSVSFVPNTEAFELRFTVPVPVDTPLGAQFCNFAKTTAAPSASQASNRKAGPACFTVGGALRIEKRDTAGRILPGAGFRVECRPTTGEPPTLITGLSSPSTTNSTTGVVSATGTAGDGTIAIVGPSGTPCTVTETSAPSGFALDPTPRNLVIPVGTSQTIEVFVNTQTAGLTITKTSDGDGTFNFAIVCESGFTERFTIVNSGTKSFADLLVGDECTVTEDEHLLFDSASDPPNGVVVITDDNRASVAFTNTRKVADLTIRKVTNGATGPTFVFDVDCDGKRFTVEIVDEGTATIADLPTGTTCTVVERGNDDFTSVVVPDDGMVEIDDDGATVAFTNTRKTGALVITKTTTGGTGTFTFTVDCTGTAFDSTVTITDSGSATIDDIPTGTSCTVTETTDPEFTSTVTPIDGTVVIAVGDNRVAFTNTAKPAALAIIKTADAGTVTAGDAIGFTVTVTSIGTGTVRNATLNDPLPGATGVSWTISPAFAGPGTCAMTGAAPLQTLACSFGDLAPTSSASVHVSSATSLLTLGTLPNTATARGSNASEVRDAATIAVTAPPAVVLDAVVNRPVEASPAPAPVRPPLTAAAPATLPRTGSPVSGPVRAALLLLALGGLALIPQHLRNRQGVIAPQTNH